MFISQTTTRRTANKTYRSVRLVESRRVGRKVQQKTLLNLGAHFAIPKAQWAELVEIIEARLAGNEFLFEPAPELTATAEAIVQKLRSREMVQAADDALMGDTANVQLDSLEMDNGRSVGCERLALEARESLRFSEALKNVGMSDRDARIAMAMVTARMVHPKFSSWSLIPASFGRCFHAISVRLRPIVRPKRITQWVSRFQVFQMLLPIQHRP